MRSSVISQRRSSKIIDNLSTIDCNSQSYVDVTRRRKIAFAVSRVLLFFVPTTRYAIVRSCTLQHYVSLSYGIIKLYRVPFSLPPFRLPSFLLLPRGHFLDLSTKRSPDLRKHCRRIAHNALNSSKIEWQNFWKNLTFLISNNFHRSLSNSRENYYSVRYINISVCWMTN